MACRSRVSDVLALTLATLALVSDDFSLWHLASGSDKMACTVAGLSVPILGWGVIRV